MSPDPAVTTFAAMGGRVEVQLPAGGAGSTTRVEHLFAEYERVLSRFLPDSELSALNRSAPVPFSASAVLFEAVSEALGWACVTDGVFDPTVIDALEATGYDRPFEHLARDARTMLAARPATRANWRAIELDAATNLITLPAGTRLDLGGIGKGFTVDHAVALLGPHANVMINASGDLYAAGDGPDGDGWYIGVQDPFALDQDLAVLNVNDCGVATSGSIKRQWTIDDARYHHLIDPRRQTSSSSDLLTVTVVAHTATQADVLAKTAFLLGAHAGIATIERFAGAECLAVTSDGTVVSSSGISEYYA